jgi:polyhydroxybutyrate depolymerase
MPRTLHRKAWPWFVLLAVGCSNGGKPLALPAFGAGAGASTAGSSAQPPAPVAANGGAGASAALPNAAGTSAGTPPGSKATAGAQAAADADAGHDPKPSPADAADDAGMPAAAVRGTGPGDWRAGDYPPDINAQTYLEISGVPGQNGNVRQYKVHVPPSYDPRTPTPVVFCIHGLLQDTLMFCVNGTQLPAKSDQAGFILIMPNGYQNSWNGGSCCGAASDEHLDDVALFRAIFAAVGKHVNIDLGRVYATGLSNGAYMSYRLACDAADMFTAVAPSAGAIGKNDIGGGTNPMSDFVTCEPSRPISVLDIHGTADGLIPYSLQAASLKHITAKNGCAATTKPATTPRGAGDTTCVTYDGCSNGIEVTGCSIANGGHCWFGSEDCGTGGGAIGAAVVGANSDSMRNNDAVWSFFQRLSR